MFAVVFEVCPKPEAWDAYLSTAKMLRPELERIDGFVGNVRYRSLTRAGWILSLSTWRDEKALVRWRTHAAHHSAQERGRDSILLDYHLRVGEIISEDDTTRRSDETATGQGTVVSLVGATLTSSDSADVAAQLGLDTAATGLVAWDIFNGVLAPEDTVLLQTWKTVGDVRCSQPNIPGAWTKAIRIIRDYGMFDRREAPQYFPEKVEL
jgi:heme-degrading monooxygenase HmoA